MNEYTDSEYVEVCPCSSVFYKIFFS